MKAEIAKMERMAQQGSGLLSLIQNTDMPVIDLLIRESVQNSIDAANNTVFPIRYDISVSDFKKHNLSKHFNVIGDALNEKFENEEQKSIIIRDWNTTGLTGPLHDDLVVNEDYGNLLKLIYQISMPQTQKHAGGSWGLGKTVYFRVGIGLVIYYSRILKEDNTYESRLAACLVENESKHDALIPDDGSPKRGIAWWGESHSDGSTRPITDEAEIDKILNDFNVTPYVNDQTGTTVVIPFINSDKLIHDSENGEHLWWHHDINYYMRIALQRWYAPRIDNSYYPYGNYLLPTVNGEVINTSKMEPFFSVIRALYIEATNQTKRELKYDYINRSGITVSEIAVHKDLKSKIAGYVAFTKVNKEQLKMTVPDNKKSPFQFLEFEEDNSEHNPPIITFTRKPGLLVNYEIVGKWVRGIERTASDEYIIGVFVPHSDNEVISAGEVLTLEEYLRSTEKADHTSWSDTTINNKKLTIVDRIQKRVSQNVTKTYDEGNEEVRKKRSSALSKALAKELLPPKGFGKKPSINQNKENTGNGNGGKNRSSKSTFHINNAKVISSGNMELYFTLNIISKTEAVCLKLQVDAEGNKKIDADEWEEESSIGTKFPLEFRDVTLLSSEIKEQITIEYLNSATYGVSNGVYIYTDNFKGEIEGYMTISSNDHMVQASIEDYFYEGNIR